MKYFRQAKPVMSQATGQRGKGEEWQPGNTPKSMQHKKLCAVVRVRQPFVYAKSKVVYDSICSFEHELLQLRAQRAK